MVSSAMEIRIEYSDLFEYSLDFLFIIDLKGIILDVNKVAVKTLEYSRNEILSMNITDLIIEEDIDPILDRKKELLDIGRISQYNIYRLKKKNGEKIYLESHGIPLREDGEIQSILGIGHEITDIIQDITKQKKSEEKFQTLFDNSTSGIAYHKIIYDQNKKPIDYIITDINPKYEEILPFKKEDVLNKRATEVYEVEKAPYLDIYSDVANTGVSTSFEAYFPPLNKYFSISVRSQAKGEFITVFDDITERKITEEVVKSERDKLQALIEAIPIGITISNPEGRLSEVNSAALEMFGYDTKEDFLRISSSDLFKSQNHRNMFLKMQEEEIAENLEFLGKRKDETSFWILLNTVSHIRGNETIFINSYLDITYQKESELKLKKHSEELSILNKIISLGNESTNLQEFLEKSYDHVLDIVSFDRGGIYLYDNETRHNKLVLHKNVHTDFVSAVEDVDISREPFNVVFDKTKSFYIEDFSKFMENSKELGVHSATIIPIRSKNEYVGSLNIGSPIYQALSQNELEMLMAIGNQMGIIIHKFESEKKLKESEEKFRTLFENATDGILLADTNTWQIFTGNKKICTMLGYSLEEMKNFKLEELHPKKTLSTISDQFNLKMREELPSAQYIPMQKKDGTIIYCDINSSQIQLAGKTYYMSIFRDITIRKNAEEALKKERDKLKAILDGLNSAGVGIDIIQKDYKILFQNKVLQERFGESIDQRCHEMYMKLEEPCEFCPVLRAIEVNDVERSELIGSDNRHYEIIAAPLPNPDGIIDRVIEVVIDITERRKAEQDLIESEEKFRTIAEQSLMGIGILQDYELKYTNKRLAKLFDYSVEEMKNFEFSEFLQMIHPEDRGKLIKQIERRKDRTRETITYYQFRAYKKTGDLFWVEVYSKIFNYQGERASLITFLDITDVKIAEQNLKESEEKFRNIAEQSFMGIIVLQDGIFKYLNDQAAALNGYSIEENMGWKVNEFQKVVYHEDKDFVMEQARKKQSGDKDVVTNYQYRLLHKSGEIIWVENYSKTINFLGKPADLVMTFNISDKIKAEQDLKESEEKFRVLFENSTSGIAYHRIVYDQLKNPVDYILTDVNPQFESILSLKKKNVINKRSSEVYQVDYTPYLEIYSKVAETGESQSFETYFSPMEKYFNISVISPNKGEFITAFDDITDRKKVENALKESEEKFRTISDQSVVGISIIQDNQIKYINQHLLDIIGYTKEEVNNWEPGYFINLFYSDFRKRAIDTTTQNQAGKGKIPTHGEFKLIKKNGDIYWLEMFSRSINFNGAPAGMNFSIDITENKIAEKKLIESETKFRTIAEQSFMGIIIIQNGKLRYMNKTLSLITGYTIEEMENYSERDMMKLMHPEDLEYVKKRLISNKEGTMSLFSNNSFRIINKSGQLRWLEDFTSKILFQGELANLVSLVDVTDKKEAEQLIIEENRRLLELDELRKDIITRVSHELKTPLTSIYGAIQILLTLFKEKMDNEALNYVKIGHRGSIRLKQLIENLLDTSRLESKKFELHLQEVELVALINDCVSDMVYLSNSRNLSVKFEVKNEVIHEVDKLRFRQVLTNLISNAIKNTPSEGEIILDIIEDDEFIDIQVRDTGIGLTEKEMERLFEKFGKIERYGMDLNVDIEGVGLGLFISKEIVELHGGEILVQSEGRNKGSTFTVRFLKKKF